MRLCLRRRDFIAGLGGVAAWPPATRAQQSPALTIGILDAGSPEGSANNLAAFRNGLSETGFVEGRNVAIEYRSAESQNDLLPALAADLVHRQVAVITAPAALLRRSRPMRPPARYPSKVSASGFPDAGLESFVAGPAVNVQFTRIRKSTP